MKRLSDQFPPETKIITANVKDIVIINNESKIIVLHTKTPLDYKAGQYIDISWGGHEPRSYSIANAPGENRLEIHVKRGKGVPSFYATTQLQVGENVEISTAKGDNIHDPATQDDKALLIIAGGMGFTPMKAIIENALRHDHKTNIHFFWGTGTANEQYMKDYFEDLADEYDGLLFESVVEKPVTSAALQKFDNLEGYRIFIAGPPVMIDDALPRLIEKGAKADDIHFDQYPEQKPNLNQKANLR